MSAIQCQRCSTVMSLVIETKQISLVVGAVSIYIGISHLVNYLALLCPFTVAPYILLVILYIAGGILLIISVTRNNDKLKKWFIGLMMVCLILIAFYAVALFLDRRCMVCSYADGTGTYFISFILITMAGINFIMTLFGIILIYQMLGRCKRSASSSRPTSQ